MEFNKILESTFQNVISGPDKGTIANYIPELAKVKDDAFGIHYSGLEGEEIGFGDYLAPFSIQSIAKVLSLTLVYHEYGGSIWERLGVEPSGTPFNSLIQLENDSGIPRNPFINAGALVICDLLIDRFKNPKEDFLTYLKNLSGIPTLQYSTTIAASEKAHGYRNIALCNFIKSFGNIHNDPEEVVDFYFHLCSIQLSCKELSRLFLFLANQGVHPYTNSKVLSSSKTKRINAIMQTCGFYDESGKYSFKVGLPGKSGVGGGIIAILPGSYAIAIWSPKLNSKGNSFRGMEFLEQYTSATGHSIF